jgi:hypothetical protein
MRIPGTSETNAFQIVLGVALLSAIAVIAGAAVTPLYGIAVFGAGALAALLSKDPEQHDSGFYWSSSLADPRLAPGRGRGGAARRAARRRRSPAWSA